EFAGSLATPPTRWQIYQPFAQVEVWHWGSVGVRTSSAPESLVEPLRRAIAELDPDVPVWEARTVNAEIDRRMANSQLTGELLGGVALLGLFLALLGIYGVVAQMVVHRTSEIGVRMALGADVGQIFRMVLGAGVRLALAGTVLGVIGAWMVVRLAVTLLPEVPAMSPWLAALIAALLVGAALVASWLPARRVVRIDPVIALRGD
ncbi:MAG TPA: FtsX-like permease family protein, partial [Opitutaceae bacterium]|nr:FtsX-like permease family protein [Opitutaceae bacterium]